MAPNIVFVSNASYLPEKRQIVVEFSNKDKKISRGFSFFPFAFISRQSVSAIALHELVLQHNHKRFKFEVLDDSSTMLVAATFDDLKIISILLEEKFGFKPLLLNPVTQFFAERNWSFFDSFQLIDGELEKVHGIELPATASFFQGNSVEDLFGELQESGTNAEKEFIQKICLSNILSVPPQLVPSESFLQAEALLEKIFFKSHFPVNVRKPEKEFKEKRAEIRGLFSDVAELSFQGVWSTLLTFPFFNLGFESINCSCCKPDSVEETNLLPNSLVNCRFNVDGTYFVPTMGDWGTEFHNSRPSQAERNFYKKEWNLSSFPAGPFFRGQLELLPFPDAVLLKSNETVSFASTGHILKWFCKKRESFLSVEVSALNRQAALHLKSLESLNKQLISSHGILFSSREKTGFGVAFRESFAESINSLLFQLPVVLSSKTSRFYSYELAEALDWIQASVLQNFKDFAEKQGSKQIHRDSSRVFVKTKTPLLLVERFSSKQGIPRPLVKKTLKIASFG
ncbi:MAG: hypothetical protein J4224_02780 [Candidatus Diapherotrites archaeon]|uniref:Uncharacterized protein n=1 Tax=Candidatus Iainarchaeum sp. TaxID=3101447 RepID=A0A8T4KYR0_9ARCH|nr:hypothetical protein [Candidatus Diapherotrites archaeon]